jgi:hypothetical protein
VPEIGYRLLASGDGKSLSHWAIAKSGKLGENEPHPVTLLPTMAQFHAYALVDRRLRINKALKIEGIGHIVGLTPYIIRHTLVGRVTKSYDGRLSRRPFAT